MPIRRPRVQGVRSAVRNHSPPEPISAGLYTRRRKETRMARARVGAGLVASCLLVWGSAAKADTTVGQMLSIFKPRQAAVNCGLPTAEEQARCTVEATL